MKSFITPDGDHKITLGPDGVWMVHLVIDDPDECPLFESTDCERCLEAVAEVMADIEADW